MTAVPFPMPSKLYIMRYMMGADICNLSWGTDIDNSALYSVMKESDMLFVCCGK